MPSKPKRTPSYRHHKPSNQAFVELNGKRHYLGVYGTDTSQEKYNRLIAEWLANGRRLPITPSSKLTISELVAAYWRDACKQHTDARGKKIKIALKPLRKLYGPSPVKDFSPTALKTIRQQLIDSGLARSTVNEFTNYIRHVFDWGVQAELMPADVGHRLSTVKGLRRGQNDVRETEKIKPVLQADIDAIRPFVSDQVWTMIQLQLLSGAQPGEIVTLRPVDLDTTGDVWMYQPEQHKNTHRGHDRTVYFGNRALAVMRPYLAGRPLNSFMFSPAEAEASRRAKNHKRRKTPLTCGNRPGTNCKPQPTKRHNGHYTVVTYRRAIARACDKAFPVPEEIGSEEQRKHWQKKHRWSPNQLRHTSATILRKQFGIEAARVILGHRSALVTEIYAELDHQQAVKVIRKVG